MEEEGEEVEKGRCINSILAELKLFFEELDAAYCNRDEKRSTTGTGVFATASKVQKTATKSSTEAEMVAVSNAINIPLWLRDFITYQG